MRNLRPISFFICSSYRDMKAERAYLHEVVLAELAPVFQDRGFRLEFKDPRWQSRSEEDADGPASLSQSLAFIDRCRPCFLGLFGSGYGKVIPRVPEAIGGHYPEIQFYARCSRAHLETLYGVLQNPKKAEHAFFYFRKPDFLETLPESDQVAFESPTSSPTQRATEQFKLKMLKEAIVGSGRPIHEYVCQWDGGARTLTGLEGFGEKVKADLMSLLDNLFPRIAAAPKVSVPAGAPGGRIKPVFPPSPAVPATAVPPPTLLPTPPVPVPPPAALLQQEFVEEFADGNGLAAKEKSNVTEETLHGDEEPLRIEGETKPPEEPAVPVSEIVAAPEDEPLKFPDDSVLDLGTENVFSTEEQGMHSSVGRAATPSSEGLEGSPADQPLRIFPEEEEPSEAAATSGEAAASDNPFAFADEAPAVIGSTKSAVEEGEEETEDPAAVIAETTAALIQNPDDGDLHRRRAAACLKQKDYAAALADYEELIRIEPQDAQAYNDRAWLWATCPDEVFRDGARAVESAKRAVELDGSVGAVMFDPEAGNVFFRVEFKETLAAAQAEASDFEAAVSTIDEALVLASKQDRPRLLYRRKLFEAKTPYRDTPGADDPSLYAGIEEEADVATEPGVLDQKLAGPDGAALKEKRRELLQKVAAHPDDLGAVRAYADWLTELGDPLGEFIRTDLDLEALPPEDEQARKPLDDRWGELVEKHGRQWVLPLKALGLQPILFGRFSPMLWMTHGVVDSITIDRDGVLPERAEELFDAAPALRKLSFEECTIDVPGLALLPQMEQIVSLSLSSMSLSAEDVSALASSPHLGGLTELELGYNEFREIGAAALAASPTLRKLETLELRSCEIGTDGAIALAGSPVLDTVKNLRLGGNNIGAAGMKALAESPHVARLEQLDVESNHSEPIGPEGAAALAGSPHLANLKSLTLGGNSLGDDGVKALAASTTLTQLESLDLSINDLTAASVIALADAPLVERLGVLDLTSNENIGPQGAKALALSPRLGPLKELKLSRCGIKDEGLIALASSERVTNLTKLDVGTNGIGAEGARALAYSAYLANLVEIDLRDNELGPDGIQALIDSPYLAHAKNLWLSGTKFTPEQEEKLKQRFGEAANLY